VRRGLAEAVGTVDEIVVALLGTESGERELWSAAVEKRL
jgi:hypothetical protein